MRFQVLAATWVKEGRRIPGIGRKARQGACIAIEHSRGQVRIRNPGWGERGEGDAVVRRAPLGTPAHEVLLAPSDFDHGESSGSEPGLQGCRGVASTIVALVSVSVE